MAEVYLPFDRPGECGGLSSYLLYSSSINDRKLSVTDHSNFLVDVDNTIHPIAKMFHKCGKFSD